MINDLMILNELYNGTCTQNSSSQQKSGFSKFINQLITYTHFAIKILSIKYIFMFYISNA